MMTNRILLSAALLVVVACSGPARYDLNDVSEVSVTGDTQGTVLKYRVPTESLYFSPGVKSRVKDGKRYLEIIRCKVGRKCAVDFPATVDGETHTVALGKYATENLFLIGPANETKPVSK
jgi:hypothetical protein